MSNKLKFAACCVVLNKESKILSVTRGKDLKNLALPGGKIEPGELIEEGCLRELKEETNLDGKIIKPLYVALLEDYVSICFLVKAVGEAKSSEEGQVQWVEPIDLTTESCSFKDYNKEVFKLLKLL